MKYRSIAILLSLSSVLFACSGNPPPHGEPAPYAGVKVGTPYKISGQWYVPAYNKKYDEIGMASWYGPGFHGGRTACGEKYDQNALTAAHRTLPLPSIVRVTNLNNGKSAIVRVNDRGPFAHNRIIDVSHAAAVRLGMISSGTAKVRVQFLEEDTRKYVDELRGASAQYAMNDPTADFASSPYEPEATLSPSASASPNQSHGDDVEEAELPVPSAVAQCPMPSQKTRQTADEFSVIDDTQASEPAAPSAPVVGGSATATTAPFVRANGHFFVQAGVFSVEENAQKLLERISDYGVANMKQIVAKQRTLYQVMVGPYENREEARDVIGKLAGIGIPDAKIIRD